MKLAGYKYIYENDFNEEERELVRKLANSLNIGIENVYLALNNRLTFQDNFQGTYKQIEVTLDAKGKPTDTTAFQLDKQGGTQYASSVNGILILKAENLTNPTVYPTAVPLVSFSQDNELLTVEHIAGLPAGYKFRLTLMAFN